MNNKPVAWMVESDDDVSFIMCGKGFAKPDESWNKVTPVYTHPVNPKYDPETGEPLIDGYPLFSGLPHPVKELTDEEIIDCVNKEFDLELKDGNATVLAFARAILRKASEK